MRDSDNGATAPPLAVPWWLDADRTAAAPVGWGRVTTALGTWAHEHDTSLRVMFPRRDAAGLAAAIESARERAMRILRAPGVEVTGWLAVYACGTDLDGTERLANGLLVTPHGRAWMREWLTVGPLGALAYAAGLSLAEAQADIEAGTLDPEGLAVLAGLRGWTFPPPLR